MDINEVEVEEEPQEAVEGEEKEVVKEVTKTWGNIEVSEFLLCIIYVVKIAWNSSLELIYMCGYLLYLEIYIF